jgi:hypothetical protein
VSNQVGAAAFGTVVLLFALALQGELE